MNKIVIKQNKDEIDVFVYVNDVLVEKYYEKNYEQRLEGNIYIGKVKDIVKGIQAAFIDIGEDRNALIHIEDIIEKESNITGNVNVDISKYNIAKELKPNDKIIVQIKKDCDSEKGPRVTKDIKLVGKYIILMPFAKFITVSKKIQDEEKKNEFKNIIGEKLKEYNYGAIVRTSAEKCEIEDIIDELEELIQNWESIKLEAEKSEAPKMLYNNNGIIGKLIIDYKPNGVKIFVNNKELKKLINDIDKDIEVEVDNELKEEINRDTKIWLKCGGFIKIDCTEALVAIDVNTGKYTGKSKIEETVFKVNLEAVKEIAKQVRLHDLGGIIVIDFIDMFNDEDRKKVREAMEEEFKKDRSKVQVLEFTKLGLLEVTRKHILGR